MAEWYRAASPPDKSYLPNDFLRTAKPMKMGPWDNAVPLKRRRYSAHRLVPTLKQRKFCDCAHLKFTGILKYGVPWALLKRGKSTMMAGRARCFIRIAKHSLGVEQLQDRNSLTLAPQCFFQLPRDAPKRRGNAKMGISSVDCGFSLKKSCPDIPAFGSDCAFYQCHSFQPYQLTRELPVSWLRYRIGSLFLLKRTTREGRLGHYCTPMPPATPKRIIQST